jgi:K+-transporting ATPase ATPase C chain
MQTVLIALRVTFVTLIVTGLAYPLAVTGLAQLLFPRQANGSLVTDWQGRAVGSELIGQGFTRAGYLQLRPSAAGDKGWDATASSPSNLAPTSKKLHDRMVADVDRLRRDNPETSGPVPAELVAASASGLDPHLSPDAARFQVPRVAKARGLDPSRVQRVVDELTEGRELGVLGEPRVNVLLVNLALDLHFGAPAR